MTTGHHHQQTNAAVRAKYEPQAVQILEQIMRRQNYRSIVRDEISHVIDLTVARETEKMQREIQRLKKIIDRRNPGAK